MGATTSAIVPNYKLLITNYYKRIPCEPNSIISISGAKSKHYISNDALAQIFLYLPLPFVCKYCTRVCKQWHELLLQNEMWNLLAVHHLRVTNITKTQFESQVLPILLQFCTTSPEKAVQSLIHANMLQNDAISIAKFANNCLFLSRAAIATYLATKE